MCDYYTDEGQPIKCINCDSTDIKEITRDTLYWITCEFECVCQNCKQSVGYWAYGSYDPAYLDYNEFLAKKEAIELLNKHGVSTQQLRMRSTI